MQLRQMVTVQTVAKPTLILLTILRTAAMVEKLQLAPLIQLAMAVGAALAVARVPKGIRRAALAAQTVLPVLIVVRDLVQILATPALVKDAQRALLPKRLALSTPMAEKAAAAM